MFRKRDLSPSNTKCLNSSPSHELPTQTQRDKHTYPRRDPNYKSKSPSVKVSRNKSKGMNLTISSFTEEIHSTKTESETMNMSKTELINALKQYKIKCVALTKENENLVL
jgi:hypothetical protein